MPIQRAIKRMQRQFMGNQIWVRAERHLQNIHAYVQGWNGISSLPISMWASGNDAEAVSGQGRYKDQHPHVENSFLSHIQNDPKLISLMEDAARFKQQGVIGQQLVNVLQGLDLYSVNIGCRFFVRRFINLLFPDEFTAISHDAHLDNVQTILALNALLPSTGPTFLEKSFYTRKAIDSYLTLNNIPVPSSYVIPNVPSSFFVPALAFHIK